MKIRMLIPVSSLLFALLGSKTVLAGSVLLVDRQGSTPNRVAVFANTIVFDRNPAFWVRSQNSYTINQFDLTLVFESPTRPYWTKMSVQFKCLLPSVDVTKKGPAVPTSANTFTVPDRVEFRIERGLTSEKDSPETTKLAPTVWQTTTGHTMRQAYRIGCNEAQIANSIRAAFDGQGTFSPTAFRKEMDVLGLTGSELAPDNLSTNSLAEFTWNKIWEDVPPPDINEGRQLTQQEIAEFSAKLAARQQELRQRAAQAANSMKPMQDEFKFRDEIARIRGNRKLSEVEVELLIAWRGKTERDVAIAMGEPRLSEAGGLRFLSYGKDYDTRIVVQNIYSGAVWTDGVYRSCNIQFILTQDASRIFRVADVIVTKYRDGSGWAPDLCGQLVRAPRN